jgi:hypothetical protein
MNAMTDFARLETEWGIVQPGAKFWLPDEWRGSVDLAFDELMSRPGDFGIAMDALPTLVTTPNAGIPPIFTTGVDPKVIEILLAPNKAAVILGEEKRGDWADQTWIFPLVERTGEVSSYGDFNANGRVGLNPAFPERQSYLFQTVTEYGELEMDRAGKARINWVSQLNISAATTLNKFQNLTYFFGVSGLKCYGLLNDPSLSASLSPGTKAAGNGNVWIYNGAINATANEIYADIESLFYNVVTQTAGIVTQEDEMILALPPGSAVALTATNSFNVNVNDLLKKNFPKLRVETAVQYGLKTTQNPQGITGGNFAQLIAKRLEGNDVGFCGFNEKMRAHPIIRYESSFRQKKTAGTWGAIIEYPIGIASMLGI